jgi:hypothetical protein
MSRRPSLSKSNIALERMPSSVLRTIVDEARGVAAGAGEAGGRARLGVLLTSSSARSELVPTSGWAISPV